MNEKYICTAEFPWNDSIKGGAIHPDAKEISCSETGGGMGGDIITLKCPNCKKIFEMELPQ